MAKDRLDFLGEFLHLFFLPSILDVGMYALKEIDELSIEGSRNYFFAIGHMLYDFNFKCIWNDRNHE